MTDSSSKPVVLLADDDPFILSLYRDKLARAGYSIESVSNGEEAIRWMQRKTPALLLLDLNMPRVNGIEVLRFVRERSSRPDIPVVVLSNACTLETIEEVNRLHPTRFLIKRETAPEKVVEAIRGILEPGPNSEGTPIAPIALPEAPPSPEEDPRQVAEGLLAAPSQKARAEIWIRLYGLIQDQLHHLKAASPLSLPHQFGFALEHFFDDLYVRGSVPHARSMEAIQEALGILSGVVADGEQVADAASSPIALLSEDAENLSGMRRCLDRPGFAPIAVQREESLFDLLQMNSFRALLWALRRSGHLAKAVRRLRELPRGRSLPVLFLLADDAEPKEDGTPFDSLIRIATTSAPESEWMVRLYGMIWRTGSAAPDAASPAS